MTHRCPDRRGEPPPRTGAAAGVSPSPGVQAHICEDRQRGAAGPLGTAWLGSHRGRCCLPTRSEPQDLSSHNAASNK